jgi:hypothetical protein
MRNILSWRRPLLDSSIADVKDISTNKQPQSESCISTDSTDVPLISVTYLDSSDTYPDVYLPGTILHESQIPCDHIAVMGVTFIIVILTCITWFFIVAK